MITDTNNSQQESRYIYTDGNGIWTILDYQGQEIG